MSISYVITSKDKKSGTIDKSKEVHTENDNEIFEVIKFLGSNIYKTDDISIKVVRRNHLELSFSNNDEWYYNLMIYTDN